MKKRILSAAILIAIFVPLIVIGGLPFKIGVGIVSVLAFKEAIDLKKKEKDLPSIIKVLGMISLLILIFASKNDYLLNLGLSFRTIGCLLILLLGPTIFYGGNDKYTTRDAFYLIGWILLLGVFFNILIVLVDYNVLLLVFLLLITVLNDTFALIFGKLIGKHKLIVNVSPGKTWEGSLCGVALGTFVAVMFYLNFISSNVNVIKLCIFVAILSIIGQIGDLVFSKIKREAKIKDFSKLIPGHGGVLDRLDSLIFVVIAFLIMFTIL